MRFGTGFVMLIVLALSGCGSSRWAMNHDEYAAKYSHPYQSDEKIPRMAKQLVDARHIAGKGGFYVGGAGAEAPASGGGEIGLSYFPSAWLETKGSVMALAGTGEHDFFLGVNGALRAQLPSRVTPFAGVGFFAGGNKFFQDASSDGVDNDDDFVIDEPGESFDNERFFAAVYPEAGVNFWINGATRLSVSGSYYVTTSGRDDDFWLYGASILLVPGAGD